jgi:hypothetical protein
MIVGWAEKTASGVRIFESQERRFFMSRSEGRSRRALVTKMQLLQRGIGWRQRENYRTCEKRLDGLRVSVRISWEQTDGAA